MIRRSLVFAGLTLALSGPAFAQEMVQGKGYVHSNSYDDEGGEIGSVYHSQKVAYHVDESVKFKLLLGNIKNQINALASRDATLEIVVVANGEGYGFLLTPWNGLGYSNTWIAQVQALQEQGVVFEICRNTMNNAGIKEADLLPDVRIVPAGVATLTELQMRGYAYLKP